MGVVARDPGNHASRPPPWLGQQAVSCNVVHSAGLPVGLGQGDRVLAGDVEDLLQRVQSLRPLIEAHRAHTETAGRIAPEVLSALREDRLFSLLLPRESVAWAPPRLRLSPWSRRWPGSTAPSPGT